MPILPKVVDQNLITLPERHAVKAGETDVLVVGGGPAGIGAAVGAAKAGSKVILVERYGFLGGNATASLVMPLMSFHTDNYDVQKHLDNQGADFSLVPHDHGPGLPTTAGVLEELLKKLIKAKGAIPPSLNTGYVVPFDPEIFKFVAMEMLDEAGIQFLFHSFASQVIESKGKIGVAFETKSGPIVIEAKTVVDCTGDGDIAKLAGASFEIGRDLDGAVQPMTLMFRMGDFQRQAFENYAKEHPDQWKNVYGLWDLVKQATANGELELQRDDILFFGTPHPHEIAVNSTRVRSVLGTNVWDLSYAEWNGRKQMRQIVSFLQKYVPGFQNAYAIQSGVQVGVRETRRINGEYRITLGDILEARKFNDAIARGSYPVDIHDPKGKGTILKRLPPGEYYEIPLRALIPQNVERVLTAGRCISGTHEAHSSYRVMPTSMATGQAAGVCAAIAARANVLPREVEFGVVQEVLHQQGAII